MPDTGRVAIERLGPLAAYKPITVRRKLEIKAGDPLTRFVFRGEKARTSAGRAFGVTFPIDPCRAKTKDDRSALWLGPDEWLLLAPEGSQDEITAGFARMRNAHSVVDVSHRNTSVLVEGALAEDVLSAGCPLDLIEAEFPTGMCTRTVIGRVEVVLWRTAVDTFHVEVWRSFADYLFKFLDEAAREYRVSRRGG